MGELKNGPTEFERLAPRLALAHRQRKHEIHNEDMEERRYLAKHLELERLIAHRELQLQRAFIRGNGGYISQRQRKLGAAVRAMEALEKTHKKGKKGKKAYLRKLRD